MFDLAQRRRRRSHRKLYRAALRAGLNDLGPRMRNEIAVSLRPGEAILDDDAVLIADTQGGSWTIGQLTEPSLSRYGWMVVTNQRVIWALPGSRRSTEVPARELRQIYAEEDAETYRWEGRRAPNAVTFIFGEQSQVRSHLHRATGLSERTA